MTTWVLLRGWAREARHWEEFAQVLAAALPPGDRVVAPDLPGNGVHNSDASPLSASAMVAALRADLAQRRLRGPYAVVALSLGGMVAWQWACERPRELAACVLINTSVGGRSGFWQRLRPAAYLPLLGLLRPGVGGLERERAILALTSNHRAGDAALAARWAGYALERPVGAWNALRQLVAAARYRAPPAAPAVPILLLAAQADRLVAPECSHGMARHWQLPVCTHATAGHDLPLDDPHWVAAQVLRWWDTVGLRCHAPATKVP